MNRETMRQLWYAQVLVWLPLTMWLLNTQVDWVSELPRVLHWALGLGVGLALLVVLRLSNRWESAEPAPSRSISR